MSAPNYDYRVREAVPIHPIRKIEISTTEYIVVSHGDRYMNEKMTQEQRLDYLVEEFKTDSVQYKNLQTPADTEGKHRILRSLMNIRMPKQMPERVLEVQDEYLKGRADEKGIVQGHLTKEHANQRAAEIAVETVRNWLDETGSRMKVVFNVYKDLDLKIYSELCE